MNVFKKPDIFFSSGIFLFVKHNCKECDIKLQFQTFLGLHDFFDDLFRLGFLAG